MIYVLLVSSEYRQSGLKVYKGVLRSFSLKAFLWALPDLAVRVSFVIFFWRAADYFGWKFLTLPAYSWFAHWIKLIGSFFLQTNVMFEPLFYLKKYSIFLAIPFYLLLLLIIPILAYWEEEMFRGHESWYGRIVSSVLFGLFHLTVNYNLLSIFALMISGYFYTYLYALRKKDLLENPEKFIAKKIIKNISPSQIRKACLYYTTAVHAFQNMLLVTFLFLMLIFKT
jgi:membrane protease YdiL (CAAX protease family)